MAEQAIVWRAVTELREHPHAALVPEMSQQEWVDFLASVAAAGVREPLRTSRAGVVLDGRHRLRAARELGLSTVPCLHIDLDPDQELDYVVAAALERRHLTPSQKAALAVDLAAWKEEQRAASERIRAGARRGGRRRKPEARVPQAREPQSRDRIGARIGVSGRLIQDAERVKRDAPDLHELVRRGEINIPEARRRLRKRERVEPKRPALPALRSPRLFVADAEHLTMIDDESVDLVITSPPFNLGVEQGTVATRASKKTRDGSVAWGIAWRGPDYEVRIPESEYQGKQIRVLHELFRVAKVGASLFYHHKVRILDNVAIHPLDWLRRSDWTLRQEVVIDRESTHQTNAKLFWPVDERIYWLVKGERPRLPDQPINMPTVWRLPERGPTSWHPCPFIEAIPRRCLEAVGFSGAVVLDPFGGSMVVPRVALAMGMNAIGVEIRTDYVERARTENGWI